MVMLEPTKLEPYTGIEVGNVHLTDLRLSNVNQRWTKWARMPVTPQQTPQRIRTSPSENITSNPCQATKNTRLLKPPAMAKRIKEPRAIRSSNQAVRSVIIRDHVAGFPRQHLSQDIVVRLHGVHDGVLDAQLFRKHTKG